MIYLRNIPTNFCLLLGLVGSLLGCQSEQGGSELIWDQSFYRIGSYSSPRTSDLNQDGVLDIVMGAGTEELAQTDHGVLAIDGTDGSLLWKHPATAQIVGSATFYDITGDGVEDVFIGGRAQNLMAIDGKSGEQLWSYAYTYEDDPILQYARYNFYNSSLVPDQNEDGLPELLTVNGGNWESDPGNTHDRFPGVLMLLDLKTGAVLAADTMPDGQESYMSPVCFTQPGSETLNILIGTGGETLDGSLYLTTLAALKAQQLSSAQRLASEQGHGFIAPPVVMDLTGDGHHEVIVASHASKVMALDLRAGTTLWEQQFPQMECSNAFAVGQFCGDATPDFLLLMSKGVWPRNTMAQQVVLDGADGSIHYQDSLGCFSLSSPVAYDLDDDGYDEAIMTRNEYDCSLTVDDEEDAYIKISSSVVFLDIDDERVGQIDHMKDFKNFFSTPWIGDLDADAYLDVVYPLYFHSLEIPRFVGMRIKRVATPVRVKQPPRWGSYMGANATAVHVVERVP